MYVKANHSMYALDYGCSTGRAASVCRAELPSSLSNGRSQVLIRKPSERIQYPAEAGASTSPSPDKFWSKKNNSG